MKSFRAWVEETRNGNYRVRHRDTKGKKFTDILIERYEQATIDGKLLKGKSLANKHADKVIERYHKNKLGDTDLSLALEKLLEEYLTEMEGNGLSRTTISHSTISLKAFIRENGLKVLADITTDEIKSWKLAMTRAGFKNSTIRGRLGDLRTWLLWLKTNGKIHESPFGEKMMPAKKDPEPKYYTAAEFVALQQATDNYDAFLAWHLAHGLGLRKVEIVGDGHSRERVQYEDINWFPDGTAELHLRKEIRKGQKKGVMIPLDHGLVALLGSRRSGPIVTLSRVQLDHFFQAARKRAGINPLLTIHGLRHTFAKNYLQRGNGNLASTRDLMGHADIGTTQIYSQFEKSYFREGIEKAYERRLVEEKIAGQIVIPPLFAGQMRGKLSKRVEQSATVQDVDALKNKPEMPLNLEVLPGPESPPSENPKKANGAI